MDNEIKLNFLSKRENITIIRNMIGAMLLENNPTVSFINEVKTIVSEAITNCIVHGYNNADDKYIDINIYLKNDCVSMDIIDKGVGIVDIEEAKTPLFSTKHDEERSGLGFTIMEMFCDKFIVESKIGEGTYIHFEKKW